MIVSFQHKFIFVAIPKTATHSIRNALRPHLGKNDWEQCVLFEEKYFPVETLAQIGHGHITSEEVRPFLLPDIWENYFRFCAVRNPYDRFVSYCRFMNRNNNRMENQPLDEMKRAVEDPGSKEHVLFRPQHEFVTDAEGQLAVDYVCRVESLQDDFDHVASEVELPTVKLERINATDSPRYKEYYDRELKEQVETFYQRDFALFDYSTELEQTNAGANTP